MFVIKEIQICPWVKILRFYRMTDRHLIKNKFINTGTTRGQHLLQRKMPINSKSNLVNNLRH